MSILCGTDFSESSSSALTAAAKLAARMRVPLHLLHSLELSEEALHREPGNSYANSMRLHLEQKAQRLRELGAQVSVHLSSGAPDDALLATAAEVSARLIVVAALGKRPAGKRLLGSHAERLAQRTNVPVLVVRNSEPFSAWADGTRPLRIMLGRKISQSSKTAMQWIEQLRAFGPCDVMAVHLYWPPEQLQRLGLLGVRDYLDPDPQVTAALETELRRHLDPASEPTTLALRLEPHLGRVGDRLAAIAQQEQSDLIVVGSHDHSSVGRLWEGSVSRDMLHTARASVACIPATDGAKVLDVPQLRRLLVATDLSVSGNAAIALAYAVAPRDATVHVVHVVKARAQSPLVPHDVFESAPAEGANLEHAAARRALEALVPQGALSAGTSSQVHILESNDAAEAICQAAERLGADLICVGTHGRTGVSRAVLGSVAQAVIQHTRRPVLLAQVPRQ